MYKKVLISMKKHIQKTTDTFMDYITRNAASPAPSYLVKTRVDEKLIKENAENFHSVVASLVFISRRCRLNIQTSVAFLCRRVAEPDEDDCKKLKPVLQYLRGKTDPDITLGADDITKMKPWGGCIVRNIL